MAEQPEQTAEACTSTFAQFRHLTKALAGAQVVVISDPELTAQVLDRSRTPHQIDKPHEPMFYHVVDEVGPPLMGPMPLNHSAL